MNASTKFRQTAVADEMRLRPGRAAVVFAVLGLLFIVLIGRAFHLQWGHKGGFLQIESGKRVESIIEIPARRGMITDRNGNTLAASKAVKALFVRPDLLEITDRNIQLVAAGKSLTGGASGNAQPDNLGLPVDAKRAREEKLKLEGKRKELARLLGISTNDLRQKINQDKNLVYLQRRMEPALADKALALKIRGLEDEYGYWRDYPLGELTGQIIGFTGAGDQGQEGVELALQDQLQSHPGSRRVLRNIKKEAIDGIGEVTLPQNGQDVTLALDSRLQEFAFAAVKDAVLKNKAKAGSVVVLDARTGEVLAMVSYPTFDPNNVRERQSPNKRNRSLVDQFEPGSTFKPFTAALAIDAGLVKPETQFAIGKGELTIGRRTIHDAHREKKSTLSVEEILKRSSNVGSALIAFRMTPEQMWQGLTSLGFGVAPNSGFPGETSGRLLPAKRWGKIEQATISYGHGVTTSLLQLARAYTVFVNGELQAPSLLKIEGPVYGKPVLRPETAAEMRRMLENVTKKDGTGARAQVPGYRVAGKTGTARKAENGGYSQKKYVSSFVGFAPVDAPRLIVAVMIDEPSGKSYYGAQVAAPVFADIVGKALHQMNVPPDYPITSFVAPVVEDVAEET